MAPEPGPASSPVLLSPKLLMPLVHQVSRLSPSMGIRIFPHLLWVNHSCLWMVQWLPSVMLTGVTWCTTELLTRHQFSTVGTWVLLVWTSMDILSMAIPGKQLLKEHALHSPAGIPRQLVLSILRVQFHMTVSLDSLLRWGQLALQTISASLKTSTQWRSKEPWCPRITPNMSGMLNVCLSRCLTVLILHFTASLTLAVSEWRKPPSRGASAEEETVAVSVTRIGWLAMEDSWPAECWKRNKSVILSLWLGNHVRIRIMLQ